MKLTKIKVLRTQYIVVKVSSDRIDLYGNYYRNVLLKTLGQDIKWTQDYTCSIIKGDEVTLVGNKPVRIKSYIAA